MKKMSDCAIYSGEKFANRAHSLIKRNGFGGYDEAKRTGITYARIEKWRSMEIVPSAETICIIAKQYGVSTDWLLGLKDQAEPEYSEESKRQIKDEITKHIRIYIG